MSLIGCRMRKRVGEMHRKLHVTKLQDERERDKLMEVGEIESRTTTGAMTKLELRSYLIKI